MALVLPTKVAEEVKAERVKTEPDPEQVPVTYLAHPFDSRKKVREWELKIEEKFDIEFMNPFYDIDGRSDVEEIDAGRAERYEKLDPEKVVMRDLKAIGKCGGVLAIIDGSLSYGTIMEIVHACMMNKPVYAIVTNGHIKHPWLQFHCNKLFESYGDFEKFLEEVL